MTLLNRLGRLFKADMHGILDYLEVPDVVLRQAIREMEDEVDKGEEELAQLVGKRERLALRKRVLEDSQQQVQAQIDLCLDSQDEELAKCCIRKKLELGQRIKELEASVQAAEADSESVEKKVNEQKQKLSAIIEKMELFSVKSCGVHLASEEDVVSRFCAKIAGISDQEVEVAYLAEKQRHAEKEQVQQL